MKETMYQTLEAYLPETAVDYCTDLWRLYGFTLKIKGDRKTKLGDFRVNRTTGEVTITVNGSLNKQAFLVTYLHEVAHLLAWRQHRGSIKPHGPEWQLHFQLLMAPLLTAEVFSPVVLLPLKKYMQRPSASTASCPALWIALRSLDTPVLDSSGRGLLLLAQVPDGATFRFCQTEYLKVEKKRTRALCQNLSNGRRYLISTAAQVERVA
ncbi:SprT-like domain-containing protein [Cesiribacter andamanensis]|uniref:SprT-like domain-containing protein n=1 Tax=Cesiribacter andamanensis TaxID=649507 RepID=UPI001376B683|nr:SprT-like domain-containing protein [Cesiribacter andamanensis]